MTGRTKDPSQRITLIAVWGNDDAESRTSLSHDEWLDICGGGELLRREASYYEGEEFEVCWAIEDRQVRVSGDDGRECFIGSLEGLLIRDSITGSWIKPLSRDLKVELEDAAALTILVQSPRLRALIEEALGEERAAAMIEMMRAGNLKGSDEDELVDFLFESLRNDAETVWVATIPGAEYYKEEWPIYVLGSHGLFFVKSPEYDDIGYFVRERDAEAYACREWGVVQEDLADSSQSEAAGEPQLLVVITAYDGGESVRFRRLKRKRWAGEILGVRGEWSQTVYHQGNVSFSLRSTGDGRSWALYSNGFPRKIEAVVEALRETCAEEVAAEAMQAVKDGHGPYVDLVDDYRDLDSDLFLDYQETARERSRQRREEQEAKESTAVAEKPEESCQGEETSPQDVEPGIPADAVFLCTVEVYAELVTADLTFHIHRAAGSDTLWMAAYGGPSQAVGSNPTQDSVESAGLRLVEAAMHSSWHFGQPADEFVPGLLTEAQVLQAWSRVQEENQRLLEQAVKLTGDSEIVVAARKLGLDPEPSGTGPASWYARCPGTKHYLRIQAETGQFGCGYCKQKGGVEELRRFARTRR